MCTPALWLSEVSERCQRCKVPPSFPRCSRPNNSESRNPNEIFQFQSLVEKNNLRGKEGWSRFHLDSERCVDDGDDGEDDGDDGGDDDGGDDDDGNVLSTVSSTIVHCWPHLSSERSVDEAWEGEVCREMLLVQWIWMSFKLRRVVLLPTPRIGQTKPIQ